MDSYTETDRAHAHNEALGWLLQAIEDEYPGFLRGQVIRADRQSKRIACQLQEWADTYAARAIAKLELGYRVAWELYK